MVRGLIVSQFPPLPASQGNRMRLLAACDEFKQRDCTLDFLYYPREDGGMFSAKEFGLLTRYFNSVFTVPSDHSWPSFDKRHQISTEIYHESVGEYFKFISGRISYDFVYVNYAPYAHIFRFCRPEVVCILDTHDKLTDRRDFLEEQGLLPDFFSISQDDEGSLAAASDIVIAIKPSEGDFYREISPKPVLSIGVPVIEEAKASIAERPLKDGLVTFGFIGSSNSVNFMALTSLFGLLKSRIDLLEKGARFLIVGKVVTEVEVPDEISPYVTCIRFVEELSDFYEQCDVVIVPTIRSTGLKIKSIEALSYKKAIIATADGFDGISSEVPYHNCQSQHEMIDFFDDVLSGAINVGEMVNSSLQVSEFYHSSYIQNIEKLVACCKKYSVAVLLGDGVNLNQVYSYLFSALRFLKNRCRIDVYTDQPDFVSSNFLKFAGAGKMNVFGRNDSDQLSHYNLTILGDSPGGFSDIVTRSDVVMHVRDAGVSISVERIPERDRMFASVKPLDYIDKSYWGQNRRLVFILADPDSECRIDEVLALIKGPSFSAARNEYKQIYIVANDQAAGDNDDIIRAGATRLSFSEFIFLDPGETHSHMAILGTPGRQNQAMLSSVASMPNSNFFADSEAVMALIRIICGSDMQIQPFTNLALLARQLELALRRQHKDSGSGVRHRPNVGAMTSVLKHVKESIIDCILLDRDASAAA